MKLGDLFDLDLLRSHLEAGNVRVQMHEGEDLRIYNYTPQAQYSRAWDAVTRACRGLIVDGEDRVVARPFPKFYNHGEPGAPTLSLDAPVRVTDKLDGSLGILYPTSDGPAVATRGSFASEQAIHATRIWRTRYGHIRHLLPGITYLFEIIYPGNRIVVDYGDLDDLFLLGAVRIKTGEFLHSEDLDWPYAQTTSFTYRTLAEALAAPPRPNAEGYVIYFPEVDDRVKVKQEDYVALHRIVTGLNARTVWEHVAAERPVEEMLDGLPDEFHAWVRGVADELTAEVDRLEREARLAYVEILGQLPDRFTRKDFAALAVPHPFKWALFHLLDGRGNEIRAGFWKQVRPAGNVTPSGREFTEDVA